MFEIKKPCLLSFVNSIIFKSHFQRNMQTIPWKYFLITASTVIWNNSIILRKLKFFSFKRNINKPVFCDKSLNQNNIKLLFSWEQTTIKKVSKLKILPASIHLFVGSYCYKNKLGIVWNLPFNSFYLYISNKKYRHTVSILLKRLHILK